MKTAAEDEDGADWLKNCSRSNLSLLSSVSVCVASPCGCAGGEGGEGSLGATATADDDREGEDCCVCNE